jgi:Protein of unknown function (DUF1588)
MILLTLHSLELSEVRFGKCSNKNSLLCGSDVICWLLSLENGRCGFSSGNKWRRRVHRYSEPEFAEFQDLRKAEQQNQTQIFFDRKVKDYLETPEFAEKMRFRLSESFAMRMPQGYVGLPEIATVSQVQNSAFDQMIFDIAAKNKSWDRLLTEKSYKIFSNTQLGIGGSEASFYRSIRPADVPSSEVYPPFELTFPANDPRIAGVLTTARFFRRNVTTNLNKNRKRSAAIFKFFLCDEMRTVSVDQSGQLDQLLDTVFPETPSESKLREHFVQTDPHGQDPACIKCHERLDPMGKTMLLSPTALSAKASPGRLFFRRADGSVVDQPVSGIGDLGEKIIVLPEYESCQVQHFWKWFVGENISLTTARQQELINNFNAVGRRTQDFVSYLVTQPEFRKSAVETPSEKMAREVRLPLAACTKCHAQEPDAKAVPDFTQWPIGKNMKRWIAKIEKSTDLCGDGSKAEMPPPKTWKLKSEEKALLIQWIDLGAPDEKGQRQL